MSITKAPESTLLSGSTAGAGTCTRPLAGPRGNANIAIEIHLVEFAAHEQEQREPHGGL